MRRCHLLFFTVAAICCAQEPNLTTPPPDTKTRTEWLEKLSAQKAAELKPEEVTKVERLMLKFASAEFFAKLAGQTGGFRPVFGGQQTGSGFSLGAAWRPPTDTRKPYSLFASGVVSTRLWQRYTAGISFPRLWQERLTFDLQGQYADMNSMSYFGPESVQRFRNRSNFRVEQTGFTGILSVKPVRHLRFGGIGGYFLYNTGRGQDGRYASVEEVYTPSQVPGLDRQANYLKLGFEAEYEYLDFARGPRKGGIYRARWTNNSDRTWGNFNFRQLDMEARQYIPFFNEKRVFVLRAASTMTYTNNGNLVPFYLQPTVGGSDDVRGFAAYRFYGNNRAVANVEYRWEIFSGLDGAVFFDAGQAFDRRSEFAFKKFETSTGFGLRGNIRNITVIRVDVGISREAVRVWFKFDNFM